MTPIRKAMIWGFAPPATPYVSLTGSVDFSASQAYLNRLGGEVSVQHLLVATVARVLKEFPQGNARVVGGRIHQIDGVGVLMPVNLIGHQAGDQRGELGVALVEQVETLTLREIAASTRKTVRREQSGSDGNLFLAGLWRLAERMPQRALGAALDGLMRAVENPRLHARIHKAFPATTLISNVGAVIGDEVQDLTMQFRGGALFVPPKLSWLGTIWGASFVQDEVVPVNGVPAIRPMLPVILVFDHRLVDGVIAARMMARLGQILSEPEAFFGEDGRLSGPSTPGRASA